MSEFREPALSSTSAAITGKLSAAGSADQKERHLDHASRELSLISKHGSFDAPVFIGTNKVSKNAFLGNPGSGPSGPAWKDNPVVSPFAVRYDYDEPFHEEPLGIAEGGRSIQEPAFQTTQPDNSMSTPSASLIHHSFQSSEGAKGELSTLAVAESKYFLLCEVSKLCCGHYMAENACLVVFAFSLVEGAPSLHDLLFNGVEISLVFKKAKNNNPGRKPVFIRETYPKRLFSNLSVAAATEESSPFQGNILEWADAGSNGAEWHVFKFGKQRQQGRVQDVLRVAVIVTLDGPIECHIRVRERGIGKKLAARPSSIVNPLVIMPGKVTPPIDFTNLIESDWMSLVETKHEVNESAVSVIHICVDELC